MQLYDRGALKDFLTSILEQIDLDPALDAAAELLVPLRRSGGLNMASPARFELASSP